MHSELYVDQVGGRLRVRGIEALRLTSDPSTTALYLHAKKAQWGIGE